MKNIYLLSAEKRDKPQLALSVFFMAIFLSGPFSGKFFDLNPLSKHTGHHTENHTGTYSFFISLHDSVQDKKSDTDERIISNIPDQTEEEDTTYTLPLQKCTLNQVIW